MKRRSFLIGAAALMVTPFLGPRRMAFPLVPAGAIIEEVLTDTIVVRARWADGTITEQECAVPGQFIQVRFNERTKNIDLVKAS